MMEMERFNWVVRTRHRERESEENLGPRVK